MTAEPGEVDVRLVDILCVAQVGGGPGGLVGFGQVTARATPNLLPCEGGTSIITADVVDQVGNLLPDATFRFSTTAGLLVQTSRNTASLTLGPNQTSATVTASIADPIDEEIEEATVNVSLVCNPNPSQTLVVTASPNVVDCTGTTTITATVRDANGHVVPGRGFHFVTSTGLLVVIPNTASNEQGTATLTLRPGDGDATVAVTSGLLFGTYQETDSIENHFVADEAGLVTVRQNCLSTPTGLIQVTASAKDVTCGENVFIGLSVRDVDAQTVVDGTPLTLIASAGGFFGGEGTLLSAAQVPTTRGEANTIYTAPANFNGQVRISAASGDTFGFTTLNVKCVLVPATGTGTSNGTAPAPCIPIGDGVCITPPNTGRNLITPPSTGSAGMK